MKRSGNRCPCCEAMMIQGVYCHETGCPNSSWRPRPVRRKAKKTPKPTPPGKS